MKKLNFAIFGILMLTCLATRAFAETTIPWTKEGCESVKGTWITAHSPDESGCDAAHCNGLNFCRSNVGMNWWSALIWCKSIGRELASIEDACPNSISTSTCANLKNISGWFWISMPASGGNAYALNKENGIYTTDRSRFGNAPPALCQ